MQQRGHEGAGHSGGARGAATDESPSGATGGASVDASWTWETIEGWLGAALDRIDDVDELLARLADDVLAIDERVTAQVNEIIHHEDFQALEAGWRGLELLVDTADASEEEDQIEIRVLDLPWKDLARDADSALEFDQSQLFRKVYTDGLDQFGANPFSLLIGNYELRPRPGPEGVDDLEILEKIAGVAAASFAPFIAGAHPSFFGVDSFVQLERPMDLTRLFGQNTYIRWRALRDREDGRFVGLTVPRIILRRPWTDAASRNEGFAFEEDVSAPDRGAHLWGNAAFAFGSVVIRAFLRHGWLADIRGFQRGSDGGGLVTMLPGPHYSTDRGDTAPMGITDLIVTDSLEKELSDLGFLPLCTCQGTNFGVFYSNQSIQKPKEYSDNDATVNARISTMLQYMLCVSRFAHFLKVLVRGRIGSFDGPSDLQGVLHSWIYRYVTPDALASDEFKARHPLRDARIDISPDPTSPGRYFCEFLLVPHYQLDAVAAAVTLRTELRADAV